MDDLCVFRYSNAGRMRVVPMDSSDAGLSNGATHATVEQIPIIPPYRLSSIPATDSWHVIVVCGKKYGIDLSHAVVPLQRRN